MYWLRGIKTYVEIKKKLQEYSKSKMRQALGCCDDPDWSAVEKLAAYLFDFATHALLEYDRVARRKDRTLDTCGYYVGAEIEVEAVVECLGLLLTGGDLLEQTAKQTETAASSWARNEQKWPNGDTLPLVKEFQRGEPLLKLLATWFGTSLKPALNFRDKRFKYPNGQQNTNASNFPERLISTLEYTLSRHRFPMLSRLLGLKILAEYVTRKVQNLNDLDPAIERFEEMVELNERFDAPMHFPPVMLGGTAAEMALRMKMLKATPTVINNCGKFDRYHKRCIRLAVDFLRQSRDAYTHGNRYYDNISGLYYLFDDLNDRRIHINHALQMAGMEFYSILWDEVRDLSKDCS